MDLPLPLLLRYPVFMSPRASNLSTHGRLIHHSNPQVPTTRNSIPFPAASIPASHTQEAHRSAHPSANPPKIEILHAPIRATAPASALSLSLSLSPSQTPAPHQHTAHKPLHSADIDRSRSHGLMVMTLRSHRRGSEFDPRCDLFILSPFAFVVCPRACFLHSVVEPVLRALSVIPTHTIFSPMHTFTSRCYVLCTAVLIAYVAFRSITFMSIYLYRVCAAPENSQMPHARNATLMLSPPPFHKITRKSIRKGCPAPFSWVVEAQNAIAKRIS